MAGGDLETTSINGSYEELHLSHIQGEVPSRNNGTLQHSSIESVPAPSLGDSGVRNLPDESSVKGRSELARLTKQLKQKQSCNQALQEMFKVLLEKITQILADPQTSSVQIDPQLIDESNIQGTELLAQMFKSATGVNPEPLLIGVQLLNAKLHTLIKKLKGQPPEQVKASPDLAILAELEQNLRISQQRILTLENVLRENQLMRRALEEDVSRLRNAKQQVEVILVDSEKEKQKLVTYQDYKYNLIKQNYSKNGQVSPQVLVLLDKIHILEKKLREREFEGQRERQQQLASTLEMLEFVKKFKKDGEQPQAATAPAKTKALEVNATANGLPVSRPRSQKQTPVSP